MIFKLVIGFDPLGFDALLGKAQRIKVALTSEPALTLLPEPWPASYPSRADITAAYTGYESAYDLARDGSKTARNDRDQKRLVLIKTLKDAAPYFESVAKAANDITILNATGYDLRQPPQPVPQPLPATELTIRRNGVSGTLFGRGKAITGAVCYESQICTGNPAGEESWRTVSFTPGCSQLVFADLTPGQLYSFRLRALGREGWGAWCDIAQMMAT